MSVTINADMFSYVHELFEHPSKLYISYQENGTKYLKCRKKLGEKLQQQLNACVGEIFLCGIPRDTTAEKVAEVASLLGEIYVLRFKVHFSGASRGFAYLQYVDPKLMPLALEKLPLLFRILELPSIRVRKSRNISKLLLRNICSMTPLMVYETLSSIVSFKKLVCLELAPGILEYQIIFKCNKDAVLARREILKSIVKFGHRAIILWDDSYRYADAKFRFANRFNKIIEFPESKNDNELFTNFRQRKDFWADVINGFRYMNLF